jgi:hypothetical protein
VAAEFVLGREDLGKQIEIGHPHCNLCGACLQYRGQRHACPGEKPVDLEVLEVMKMDMRPRDGHWTSAKRV